ncbi:MAG TPA: hypothetical protein VFL79_05195 [Terriglobia bacterium]|nr:hypothetical protein [Terriglobia bacterium]
MNHKDCENEARILEALARGLAPETMDEPLRRHIAGCASCAEVIAVYELFQQDNDQLCASAWVPNAGLVWWRATLAARRAAAERALRPILIAEKASLAIGAGALLAVLFFAAPWLAGQLKHSNIFAGTVVYSFSLSSLIAISIAVCLLLMAGALYTVWAEK